MSHMNANTMLKFRATCKRYHKRFEDDGWFDKEQMHDLFVEHIPFGVIGSQRVDCIYGDEFENKSFNFALSFRKHDCFITKFFHLPSGTDFYQMGSTFLKTIRDLRFYSGSSEAPGVQRNPRFDYERDRIYVLNLESMRYVPSEGNLIIGYRLADWAHEKTEGYVVLQTRYQFAHAGLDFGRSNEGYPQRRMDELVITPDCIRQGGHQCAVLHRVPGCAAHQRCPCMRRPPQTKPSVDCPLVCGYAETVVMAWKHRQWIAGSQIPDELAHSLPRM